MESDNHEDVYITGVWDESIRQSNRGGASQGAGRPKKPETVVFYRKVTK